MYPEPNPKVCETQWTLFQIRVTVPWIQSCATHLHFWSKLLHCVWGSGWWTSSWDLNMASSRILWSFHIQWYIYNDHLKLYSLSNLEPVALAGTGRYPNSVWLWSGTGNVSDDCRIWGPSKGTAHPQWLEQSIRGTGHRHETQCLWFHMSRGIRFVFGAATWHRGIGKYRRGKCPWIERGVPLIPSSPESPGPRFDIQFCSYCFDFIPCPRDVFYGRPLFVWWRALCVVSGYIICQYACCDVIGSNMETLPMIWTHVNSQFVEPVPLPVTGSNLSMWLCVVWIGYIAVQMFWEWLRRHELGTGFVSAEFGNALYKKCKCASLSK